jgi:hypothetical protein
VGKTESVVLLQFSPCSLVMLIWVWVLGMLIWVRVHDTRRVLDLTGIGMGDSFLSVGGTRTQPESRWVRNEYFFTHE